VAGTKHGMVFSWALSLCLGWPIYSGINFRDFFLRRVGWQRAPARLSAGSKA